MRAFCSRPRKRVKPQGWIRRSGLSDIHFSSRMARAARGNHDAARDHSHAGVHAGRNRGDGEGALSKQVKEAGADILLGNTYHLMLRPGAERIARLGGLHKFMRWDGPILTDSGGFQVMSLSTIRKITEEGAQFQSHIDGSKHIDPERSIEIQCLLGSDIQMQFDECIELPAERKEVELAMELSLRWAERSKRAFEQQLALGGAKPGQALFAIVQVAWTRNCGSVRRGRSLRWIFPLRRRRSCGRRGARGDGGDLEETLPALPQDKPRYLMGVGTPQDLIESVRRGIDMFDCVMPTRNGGTAWPSLERASEPSQCKARGGPIASRFGEHVSGARDYSRAYLHHLVKAGDT